MLTSFFPCARSEFLQERAFEAQVHLVEDEYFCMSSLKELYLVGMINRNLKTEKSDVDVSSSFPFG